MQTGGLQTEDPAVVSRRQILLFAHEKRGLIQLVSGTTASLLWIKRDVTRHSDKASCPH